MKGVDTLHYKEFFSYLAYEDGRVFSTKSNKFLKGEVTKYGYLVYRLSINNKLQAFRANRLVAFLFLDVPSNYKELVVNHKDGNKLNNHYSNLEWCTHYYNNYHARINNLNNISESNSKRWQNPDFRKRTAKHFSEINKMLNLSKWKNNGRFRYDIYDKNGNNYSRSDLSLLLNLSQSYTDALIRKAVMGEKNNYFEQYGIHVKDIKEKGQSTIESDR